MKKRNLNSFKLRKESVSSLSQNSVTGGAEQEAAKKSKRWWNCPHNCTAYCK
ncbi:hypothetical protein [Kordia sp.]|uniref:hypothetical protein n=1 Tax=Kordia sp. TaxID=1965332 RepID=UPI003B5A25AF